MASLPSTILQTVPITMPCKVMTQPDPDKCPNEIPKENLSLCSQLNKDHSISNISTVLSKNQISASSYNLSTNNHP
jgi:hypothetical protein